MMAFVTFAPLIPGTWLLCVLLIPVVAAFAYLTRRRR